jgi:putative transposase
MVVQMLRPYRNITMPYNPDIHHRRSIRLQGYDYAQPGAYFVTICAHYETPAFSTIHDGNVALTEIGKIIERCWHALPRFFSTIALDAYVIMPDHFHGIIIIKNQNTCTISEPAPSTFCHGTVAGALGAMIQNFKSVSTRKINQQAQIRGRTVWQRNYFERIIRNEAGLNAARQYIADNPIKWLDLS